jgi:hypothetical protein
MMAKSFWKVDGDRVTLDVPESVERVQPLDDQEMLDAFAAQWTGKGNVYSMSRAGLVSFVDSVLNLASDQVREDLSVGGALRWARNRAKALVAAGWAKWDRFGGLDAVA